MSTFFIYFIKQNLIQLLIPFFNKRKFSIDITINDVHFGFPKTFFDILF